MCGFDLFCCSETLAIGVGMGAEAFTLRVKNRACAALNVRDGVLHTTVTVDEVSPIT